MINSFTPRQLAFTALALGTIDAGSACGLTVGLLLKAIGCQDFQDLRQMVKDWKKRNERERHDDNDGNKGICT